MTCPTKSCSLLARDHRTLETVNGLKQMFIPYISYNALYNTFMMLWSLCATLVNRITHNSTFTTFTTVSLAEFLDFQRFLGPF